MKLRSTLSCRSDDVLLIFWRDGRWKWM